MSRAGSGTGSIVVLVRRGLNFASNLNRVKLKSTYKTLVLLSQDFLIHLNSIFKENDFISSFFLQLTNYMYLQPCSCIKRVLHIGGKSTGSRISNFLGLGPKKTYAYNSLINIQHFTSSQISRRNRTGSCPWE
jgi:hypothetical protein